MALRDDFQTALLAAYEQTGREVHYWGRYFYRELRRHGAVPTAKRLLQINPAGQESKGYRALRDAGRLDLSVEAVVLQARFSSLFTNAELAEARRRLQWVGPRSVSDIASDVNGLAADRPIGGLQDLRRRLHGKTRTPTKLIFDPRSIFEKDRYAYHFGGRTELQFNIGFETIDEVDYFRQGAAFSLETSRNLPTIEPLLSKVARFNEYLRVHSEDFASLRMWYYERGMRSLDYAPTPIPPDLVKPGVFIFLGSHQPAGNVDTASVVDTFDLLLPLYEFTEGKETFPGSVGGAGFVFLGGCTVKPSSTKATTVQRQIDVQLRHNDIQVALHKHLAALHGHSSVQTELPTGNGTAIDVGLRLGDRYWFYEIKTSLSARICIREALGQLLEYAFWPRSQEPERLVVIGEPVLDKEAMLYLEQLRKRFDIPIFYQQFDMSSLTLVESSITVGPA